MGRLDGKAVLVSGAARGIGAAAARKMASEGAAVAVADILDGPARETAAAIEAAGGTAISLTLDVTTEESWQAAIDKTVAAFGKLDVLVNNAGVFIGKDLLDATMADWKRLVDVNLTGVWLGTKLATPALAAAGADSPHGSAIVNLASVAGLVGSELDPLYSLTKGGVTLFTKSAALNLARRGYRIRVNSIHPGVIETDMNKDISKPLPETIPLQRLGTAEDVAEPVRFLCSPASNYVTGAIIPINGGQLFSA